MLTENIIINSTDRNNIKYKSILTENIIIKSTYRNTNWAYNSASFCFVFLRSPWHKRQSQYVYDCYTFERNDKSSSFTKTILKGVQLTSPYMVFLSG